MWWSSSASQRVLVPLLEASVAGRMEQVAAQRPLFAGANRRFEGQELNTGSGTDRLGLGGPRFHHGATTDADGVPVLSHHHQEPESKST